MDETKLDEYLKLVHSGCMSRYQAKRLAYYSYCVCIVSGWLLILIFLFQIGLNESLTLVSEKFIIIDKGWSYSIFLLIFTILPPIILIHLDIWKLKYDAIRNADIADNIEDIFKKKFNFEEFEEIKKEMFKQR